MRREGLVALLAAASVSLGSLNDDKDYTVREEEIVSASVSSDDTASADEFSPEDIARIEMLAQHDYRVLIGQINTPKDAAIYCTQVLTHGGKEIDKQRYGGDFWESLKESHENKVVDCDAAALAAAGLLSDNGYPSYILQLRGYTIIPMPRIGYTEERFGHAIFLYKTHEGKYGSIGINETDVQVPVAKSLDEFLEILSKSSRDVYESYVIYDVGEANPDFVYNSVNNDPSVK